MATTGTPVVFVELEQTVTDLRLQLEERTSELSAARAADRELMLRTNTSQ